MCAQMRRAVSVMRTLRRALSCNAMSKSIAPSFFLAQKERRFIKIKILTEN